MNEYKNTTVSWAKSQAAIIKLLNVRKIYQTRFTNLEDKNNWISWEKIKKELKLNV